MSVEKDVENRLEEAIRRHAREGNIIPFPAKQTRTAKPQGHAVTISGDGNAAIIGSNNHVSIHVSRPRKVVAEVRPGAEHISDDQAARLQQLVHDVHLHTGKPFQLIWTSLLRHVGAPKYRLIRFGHFEAAESYLVRWLAHSTSRDETEEQERKRHIRYIKTNQRKLGRSDEEVAAFLRQHIGKSHLRDCALGELQKVRKQLVGKWLNRE